MAETHRTHLPSRDTAVGNRGACPNPCPEPGRRERRRWQPLVATAGTRQLAGVRRVQLPALPSHATGPREAAPEDRGPREPTEGDARGRRSPSLSLPARDRRVLGTQREGGTAAPSPPAPRRSGSTRLHGGCQPVSPLQSQPERVQHRQTILRSSSTTINGRPFPTAHPRDRFCACVISPPKLELHGLALPPSLPPKGRYILQCSL